MNWQETFNFGHMTEVTLPPKNLMPKVPALLRGAGLSNTVPELTRPIHYLGSKLRIVDLIRDVLDRVDPSGGPVCDLFAGSGTVSLKLSSSRTVIAVDIQQYSRVLCSALLNPAHVTQEVVEHYLNTVRSSEHARRLSWAIEPMVAYETNCRHHAESGEVEPLCHLLEHGSIISFEQNSHSIKNSSLLLSLQETVSRLRETDLINNPGALTVRYFGGLYFSYVQASQIDMLLEAIPSLPISAKDTFLAAILSTTSEIVNTVGKQFAQPIQPRFSDGRPKPNLAERIARDRDIDAVDAFEIWLVRYLSIPHSDRKHRVLRSDYLDALEELDGQVNAVYADPPYTRDHYSRYYHVLETLCLRDCPAVSTTSINGHGHTRMSRGIYRIERYQSPFCIKSKAPHAFSALFTKARCLNVPLVVSYSPFENDTGARPRLMTIKDISELARKSFRRVEVTTAGRVAHNKLNRSDMNKAVSHAAETFIICIP